MPSFSNQFLAVATLPLLLQSNVATAKNVSVTGDCQINGVSLYKDFQANTTGTVRFNPALSSNPEPWYYVATMTDKRKSEGDGKSSTDIMLDRFLAVPQTTIGERGEDVHMCVYFMNGVNEEREGNNNPSCKGVLSDKCIDAIKNDKHNAPIKGKCPTLPLKDACGQDVESFSVSSFNLSSSVCSAKNIPSLEALAVPQNYRLIMIGGIGLNDNNGDDSDFVEYDLHAQQPLPIIFKTSNGTDNSAMMDSSPVCVAPSSPVRGSRKPEHDFPPSAASRVGGVLGSVVAMSMMAGLALTL